MSSTRYYLWRELHHPTEPTWEELSLSERAHWVREVEPAHEAELERKRPWAIAIALAVVGMIAGSLLWLWVSVVQAL